MGCWLASRYRSQRTHAFLFYYAVFHIVLGEELGKEYDCFGALEAFIHPDERFPRHRKNSEVRLASTWAGSILPVFFAALTSGHRKMVISTGC